MVRKPINRTRRSQEIHYCHKCRKSTKHSQRDGDKICGDCGREQKELFKYKAKYKEDEVPVRLSGGPEPVLWGKKKVYDRRYVGIVAAKKDVEQVKVRGFDGELAWFNLTANGTL